jgi:hypothetical protein
MYSVPFLTIGTEFAMNDAGWDEGHRPRRRQWLPLAPSRCHDLAEWSASAPLLYNDLPCEC